MELTFDSSDVASEILLRLSVKSLVKFQSVCKKWLSLISSPEFQHQHSIRFPKVQQQHSLIIDTGAPLRLFHLNPTTRRLTPFSPSLSGDNRRRILHSSNGLWLLRSLYFEYLCVHNPATKQLRKIVLTPSTTHPYVATAALAFDPSKSPYYQLVCVRRTPHREKDVSYLIEVYSSESHTWDKDKDKVLVVDPPTLLTLMSVHHGSPVYCNNAVYWGSKEGPFYRAAVGLLYYCCFDLAKREIKTLACPASDQRDRILSEDGYRHMGEKWQSRFQESNGHLFHVELVGSESVAVWELDDDDDQWLLRHHHVLPKAPPPCPYNPLVPVRWRPSILTFLVDTCSLLICWNGWIRFYHIDLGIYEDFVDGTGHPFFRRYCAMYLNLRAFELGETLALV